MSMPARHWIDGEWLATGELKESRNPATYEVIGHYHDGGRDQAEAAIAAAKRAFARGDWARNNLLRADVLAQLADRFEAHQQSFIDIYKLENGKPEALQEISRIAPAMRYWSAMARTLKGESGHPGPDDMCPRPEHPFEWYITETVIHHHYKLTHHRAAGPAIRRPGQGRCRQSHDPGQLTCGNGGL